MSNTILATSRITKFIYSLTGDETNLKDSNVQIKYSDLFRNGLPYPSGVCDAHLGTTDHAYSCQTCMHSKTKCVGHEGHTVLNYPVISPLSLGDLKKWIKLICFECGQPVIEKSKYMSISRSKRLEEASKLAKNSADVCYHCRRPHPTIKRDRDEPLMMIAEYGEGVENKVKLYPHIMKIIFNKISDETVLSLGRDLRSHPRNFIVSIIKVPATTIRPDVKKIGGGRSNNDDITTMIQFIIKRNEVIPPVLPREIDGKLEKAIYELNAAFYNLIKGSTGNRNIKSNNGQLASIAQRLKGKAGRARKNQMGKRVHYMARTTITGDPTLKPDEVGVPLEFAKNLPMEEIVTKYNKKELMVYVTNGRHKYPGCTKIVKRSTGVSYSIESIKDPELEEGDKVYRHMITGDPVGFNRQPSLMVCNITTMRAVVMKDPKQLTFRMNVLITPYFSADFNQTY